MASSHQLDLILLLRGVQSTRYTLPQTPQTNVCSHLDGKLFGRQGVGDVVDDVHSPFLAFLGLVPANVHAVKVIQEFNQHVQTPNDLGVLWFGVPFSRLNCIDTGLYARHNKVDVLVFYNFGHLVIVLELGDESTKELATLFGHSCVFSPKIDIPELFDSYQLSVHYLISADVRVSD